jgi:hypothetical protein
MGRAVVKRLSVTYNTHVLKLKSDLCHHGLHEPVDDCQMNWWLLCLWFIRFYGRIPSVAERPVQRLNVLNPVRSWRETGVQQDSKESIAMV